MAGARVLGTLGFCVAFFSTRAAMAYEDQWHFGGGLGVATFPRHDTTISPALGLHASYDISDMFDVRVELLGSQHQFEEGTTTRFYSVGAGVVYKIDVLEWVPYVGILAGYYAFSGEPWPAPIEQRELGISFPLGLDYTFSRTFGMGLQIRYHGFMRDTYNSVRDAPYFNALLRAEYRLGW